MKSLREYQKAGSIDAFVDKLFEARQSAHAMHLQSKSYSEHIALDEFYNGLLGQIDGFVEVYQGQYGLISQPNSIKVVTSNPVEYLSELANNMKAARKSLKEDDTHLQNMIDEMITLTYQTVYKLKYLK